MQVWHRCSNPWAGGLLSREGPTPDFTELRVRLAPLNRFKPSSKIFYWPFQGDTSFVDLLCFCSVLCLLCLCARLFICALWSPAGKGLTSWLSFVVSTVSLSLSHWYPGSGVVLDCIDSWSLHPYLLCLFYKIIYGLVAINMPSYIVHQLRIFRNSHPLGFRQIQATVDYYKYLFYPLSIVQRNRLPAHIALLPTSELFKRAVCTISQTMPYMSVYCFKLFSLSLSVYFWL